MSALSEYYRLMVRLFESRHGNNPADLEGTILDEMDLVWQRMSMEERKTVDKLSCSIAAGVMSEEQFIEMYVIQPETIISNEQQPMMGTRGEVIPSPFIKTSSFSVPWAAGRENTQYIGFTSPSKRLDI